MQKIDLILRDITESGGGERVCVNLANAFSELGFSVEIISFYRAFESPRFRINESVKITYLSQKSTLAKNKFKKFFNKTLLRFYLNRKAVKYIESAVTSADSRADSNGGATHIILANDGTFIPPRKKIPGTKLLRLWHIKPPKKYKKVFDRFEKIIVLSRESVGAFVKLIGGENQGDKIIAIPNFLPSFLPLDELLRAREATTNSPHIILAAGRFTPEKGFARLIKMYAQIAPAFPQWQLHIRGEGPLRAELEQQIKELQMQTFIKLLPFRADMSGEYLHSELYAMSSFHEGLPMVILEAASMCVATIAFDSFASARELVDDGRSGFLVESDGEYVQRLRELMQSPCLRRELGLRARELVEARFSKEAILPLWLGVFGGPA